MAATITPALAALSSVKKVDDDSNDHYIDLDAVKASVGSAGSVVHEADTISSTPAFFAQKLSDKVVEAKRPKCDNDYRPKVGSVTLTGLAKLPFLLKDTLTDTGCRW